MKGICSPPFAVLCIVLLLGVCQALGSKYSQHANADNTISKDPKPKKPLTGGVPKDRMYDQKPFRTQKVNLVWEKAKKVSSAHN